MSNLIWNKSFDYLGHDSGSKMIQTDDGGFLLAGDRGLSYDSNHDLWLVKTYSNGIHEWNITHGDSGDQRMASVVQLSDGSLVVAGTYGSDAWLFKAQVVEDTPTTTDGASGFELSIVFLCLALIILSTRKRRP
jgi:hypothetical protein